MNDKLLIIKQLIDADRKYSMNQIAEKLALPPEAAEKLLLNYERAGHLTASEDNGLYVIKALCDIEQTVYEHVTQQIKDRQLEEVNVTLEYPWSVTYKNKLRAYITNEMEYTYEPDHFFIEPYPLRIESFDPLDTTDIYSSNIAFNVFDRLFDITESGEVVQMLAQYHEYTGSYLKIVIRKNVMFHDGSILAVDDCIYSLNRLREDKKFGIYCEAIESIDKNDNYTFTIHLKYPTPHIFSVLSQSHASIHKFTDGQFIGSGPFQIGKDYLEMLELNAFDFYFNGRPFLDQIQVQQVPVDFYRRYHEFPHIDSHNYVNQIKKDSGVETLIFNTTRENMHDKHLREYLASIIQYNLNYISDLSKYWSPNTSGFFSDSKLDKYPVPEKNAFEGHEITVLVLDIFHDKMYTIVALLESYGFTVLLEEMPFAKFAAASIEDIAADIVPSSESFEQNIDFAFYKYVKSPHIKGLYKQDNRINKLIDSYNDTPLKEWHTLNLKIEKTLYDRNMLVPVLTKQKIINVPKNIANAQFANFAFLDYRKIVYIN